MGKLFLHVFHLLGRKKLTTFGPKNVATLNWADSKKISVCVCMSPEMFQYTRIAMTSNKRVSFLGQIFCCECHEFSICHAGIFIIPRRNAYTQRNLFEILLNQTEIRLYLPYTD